MVGVAVREQDRVHAIEVVCEGLRPQVRRGVDQDAPAAGKLEQDGRPAPAIAGVRRTARAAAAADHRHAV
jgi:hypothetical protein